MLYRISKLYRLYQTCPTNATLGTSISLPKEISSNYLQKSTIGNYYYTLLSYAKQKGIEFLFRQTLSEKLLDVKTDITDRHSTPDILMIAQTFAKEYDAEDEHADAIDAYEKSFDSKIKSEGYSVYLDPLHPTALSMNSPTSYFEKLKADAQRRFHKCVKAEHSKRNIAESLRKATNEYEKVEDRIKQLHSNMLVAMQASISINVRPRYESIVCCKTLLETLVADMRAKVLSEILASKQAYQTVKLGARETIPSFQSRLHQLKRELKGCSSTPYGLILGDINSDPQMIPSLSIQSFTDSDWGKDLDSRRSRYGAILYVNNSPIRISSGLQDVIHQATSHAELDAANSGGRDITFIRQWLTELDIPFDTPTLHSDNTGAIAIAENDTLAKSSRHLDIKLFWLRDQVTNGILKMTHCTTKDMLADILTKPLPRVQFLKLRSLLGVSSLTQFQNNMPL